MPELVILKPDERAPASGDRILVLRDATMKACRAMVWRRGDVVYQSLPLPFDGALVHAQRHAILFDIATIYLQEIAGGARKEGPI